MNISVWRKWAIVWMVSVLSGFQLRAADPVVVPANTEPLTIEGNRFVTLCIMTVSYTHLTLPTNREV